MWQTSTMQPETEYWQTGERDLIQTWWGICSKDHIKNVRQTHRRPAHHQNLDLFIITPRANYPTNECLILVLCQHGKVSWTLFLFEYCLWITLLALFNQLSFTPKHAEKWAEGSATKLKLTPPTRWLYIIGFNNIKISESIFHFSYSSLNQNTKLQPTLFSLQVCCCTY